MGNTYEKLLAELCFVKMSRAVELARIAEALDEVMDDGWCWHTPPRGIEDGCC